MATATSGIATRPGDRFAAARAVADAVLYEGYLLYPYRRSSAKNRMRWQFGVLAPRAWIEHRQIPDPGVAGAAESWFQQIEGLAETPAEAALRVQLRFLQLQHRQVYAPGPDGALVPVGELDTGAELHLTTDEALPHEYEACFPLADLLPAERSVEIDVPASSAERPVQGGRIRQTRRPFTARVTVRAEQAAAPFPLLALRVRVENTVPLDDPDVPRDVVLRRSLLATHVLLGLDRGSFVSLLDPPAWAAPAAAGCANRHAFPVLAGSGPDGTDVLLGSPIILYDRPKIAPESPGDLHDATEIDEILSLRTLTLTDAEKREARATDPRAAAIVDRVDGMPPEVMARLHGALRDLDPVNDDELPWWDPRAEAAVRPESDAVLIGGRAVGRGATVRLRPRGRGTDAHDMFLAGRTATVHAVLRDVDGSVRVAVTVDGDPAAELHEWYGRFFHFTPEEVEPV
jgi:hypothetical protein